MSASLEAIPRTLGRRDLVLLKIVAIVNINNVPVVAVYGWSAIGLWVLAFVVFFVPEAVAVLALSRRYPGEGGIYLWTRRQFGEAHGFISGWCYWTNNLFYIPVLLVYMAGVLAFAAGPARAGALIESRTFVAIVAFGWLASMAVANVCGLRVGKWIQNVGAFATAASIGLVVVAAGAVEWTGGAAHPPLVAATGWEMAAGFSVMCNAFVGIELASTMGDEISDPRRDLKPAIVIAGIVSLVSYAVVTGALLRLVPLETLGVIQGVLQAVQAGASHASLGWLIAPLAIVLSISIGGAASAWFAGSSRVPFVAGLLSALPPALGRVHPKWRSPHVALITCALFAAAFTAWSLVGSSVSEGYQVLLKSAVVIQLIPFVYLFLALARLDGVGLAGRCCGAIGLVATTAGLIAAFLPTADVNNLWLFEAKLVIGVAVPLLVGGLFFLRSRRRLAAADRHESRFPYEQV